MTVGGIAVDASNNILVTGGFFDALDLGSIELTGSHADSRIFVVKLDEHGVPLWGVGDTGDANSVGQGLAVDSDESVYVTGYYSGSMSFGGEALTSMSTSGGDGFVIALSADGVASWSKDFGSKNDPQAEASGWGVAADASGNVFLTGIFIYTTDLGCGSPLVTPADDTSNEQAFAAKLDATSGACLWNDALPVLMLTAGIAVDPGGDAVVSGSYVSTDPIAFGNSTVNGTTTGSNLFIGKLDGATGAPVWGKGFGTSGDDQGTGMAVDATGRIFVTGVLLGSVDYGGGTLTSAGGAFVLASFDAEGDYRWAKVIEGYPPSGHGPTNGRRISIAVDSSTSHVLLAGWANAAIDLGCGPLANSNGELAFVAAFQQ
jgi:hypothetical protein